MTDISVVGVEPVVRIYPSMAWKRSVFQLISFKIVSKMDTACLRIKFTPLMKNINVNDSKCCLEIVPEVSCFKNFDKIKWKKDDHFFEYVVPITYKIILKKKDYQKDFNGKIDKQNPVYHSCVDLLHQSTTTDLSSGDVNRIVSENIVVSRVTSDFDKYSIIVTQANDTNNRKNVNDAVSRSVQTVEGYDGFTMADHKKTDTITTNERTQTLVFQNMEHSEDCYHKIIQTVMRVCDTPATRHKASTPLSVSKSQLIAEPKSQLIAESKSQLIAEPKSQLIVEPKSQLISEAVKTPERKFTDNLRKLSVSPMFSFHTNDGALKKPFLENLNNRNHMTPEYHFDDALKFYFNPPKQGRMLHILTPKTKVDNLITQYPPIKRPTPQERVCYFLQLMNKEILPLTYVLEDILHKYSALNKPLDLCNHDPQCKEQVDEKKKNEIPKIIQRPHNRVVYSIVFDG